MLNVKMVYQREYKLEIKAISVFIFSLFPLLF